MSLYTERNKVLMKSGNRCAFPGCLNKLTDGFQVAHIRSSKKDGPRHIPNWNDNNFDVEENLLCLCPNHHNVIDSQVEDYPIEYLERIKFEHEQKIEQLFKTSEEDDQFLKTVFDILEKYNVVSCVRNGDYTTPTSQEYIENLEYCGKDLENLIDNSWTSNISKELLNDWSQFYQIIESFEYYLIQYLDYRSNGNFFVNKNPNESRDQIQQYRKDLMNILRKYLS